MARDVLIVHERAELGDLLADILVAGGYACRSADSEASARQAIRRRRPALALLGELPTSRPEASLKLLGLLSAGPQPIPAILVGIAPASELGRKAMAAGAYDVVERPWNSVDLLRILQNAVEDGRLRREAADAKLRTTLENELVGTSDAIMRLREAIVRAANSDLPLLVSGPAGAGKKLSARLVHQKSHRAKDHFIVLDCAALEPERAEEELFGIDRADAQDNWAGTMLGAIDRADRGTLLLSAIEALPESCQRKLAAYLAEGGFERAAGSLKVEADARIIAATSADLAAAVSARRFRDDLYQALRANLIRVPALDERRGDIPLLVAHFRKRASGAAGLPAQDWETHALAALQAAEWPGNVRELKNVVERLLIARRAGAITTAEVEAVIEAGKVAPGQPLAVNNDFMAHHLGAHSAEMPLFGKLVAELIQKARLALRDKLRLFGKASLDQTPRHTG